MKVVGKAGLEPTIPRSQSECLAKLGYFPIVYAADAVSTVTVSAIVSGFAG